MDIKKIEDKINESNAKGKDELYINYNEFTDKKELYELMDRFISNPKYFIQFYHENIRIHWYRS